MLAVVPRVERLLLAVVEASIQRTARNSGRRSSQPAGKSGKATTRSSPHLTSPHAREILDQESITVVDYRPLQQAWNA